MREFYTKCQKAWMETNSIKDGDLVRILNKIPTGANGWDNSWAGDMDDLVGSVGEVQTYRSLSGVGAAGICVYFSKINDYYHFPYFVLEKVEPKEKEIRKDSESKEISEGNISCYNFETNDWFNFPYFVLEKIMERKDKEWTVSYGLKVKTGDPVLMRDSETGTWRYSVFSHNQDCVSVPYPYYNAGIPATFCIPYVGNEYLVGTTDDYKTPKETTKPKFVFGAKVKATLSCGEEKEGVLIGIDTKNPYTPFEVAVRDEDADLGRIRYWAESVTYID